MIFSNFKLNMILIFICLGIFSCNNDKTTENNVYVFYYFEGHAGEHGGLFAAYSHDLHTWQPLADSLIAAEIGEWKVFRDPSVMRTPDGKFHVVWTTGSSGFGYACSEDGINWQDKKLIVVEDHEKGYEFANVWAPELYAEGDSIYVLWSSTLMEDYVPPEDPEKWWTSTWNHRFYYTSTTDFQQFSPTRKFWDPGFNAIDAVIHKTDSVYYVFFKDERRPKKQIMMAKGKSFIGPYEDIQPLAYSLTEGAIALATDTAFLLYYDYYHEHNGYRYITSKDMTKWSDEILPEKKGFDDVIRHGSIVKVTEYQLINMQELVGN